MIEAVPRTSYRSRSLLERSFLAPADKRLWTLAFVVHNHDDQETTMPLKQASPAQLVSIRRAISRLGERGDAGRTLRRYLEEQLDPENADQSVRCAMKNLEAAIREMREELRAIMY